jgi:hypothetical protein
MLQFQLMHEGHNKKTFVDLCHASEQIRQEKLMELAAFRQQWRDVGAIDPKEQIEILQVGTCTCENVLTS